MTEVPADSVIRQYQQAYGELSVSNQNEIIQLRIRLEQVTTERNIALQQVAELQSRVSNTDIKEYQQ
jgi:hypothetical protein